MNDLTSVQIRMMKAGQRLGLLAPEGTYVLELLKIIPPKIEGREIKCIIIDEVEQGHIDLGGRHENNS